MARLWSSGFELNTSTTNVEWDEIDVDQVFSIVTSPVRSGTYALKMANNTFVRVASQKVIATTAHFFIRFYIYITAYPNANTQIFRSSNGGSIGLKLTTTGAFQLLNSSTQIGSDSSVLSLNQWYRIEIEVDNSLASGSMVGKGYINGSQFAGASNLTIGTGNGYVRFEANLNAEGDSALVCYFDDIAVNDNTLSFQNSLPGDGAITHLKPNAAGDNNSFSTQVGGTAGSSNNYTRVNEVTPDDVTSYNADTVTNNVDDFNVDDTPASIGSGDTINVVQVGVRYSALVASLESSLKVRIKKASGGTVSKSATITPTSTSWVTNANSTPFNHPLTLYQDPDSSNWTKATLDTAQIGYEISSGNTNKSAVSDIWLLIDSTPAATTTSSSSSSSSTSSTSSSTSSTSSSSSSTSSTSSSTSSTSSSSSTSSTSSSTSSTSSSSSTSSTSSSSSTSSTSSSSSTSSTSSSTSSTSSSSSTSSTSTSSTSSSHSTSSTSSSSSISTSSTSSSSTSTTLPPATTSSSSSSTSTSTSTSTTTILFHPKIDILHSLLHGRPSGEFS